jgi:PAS domain S-box-containing protein
MKNIDSEKFSDLRRRALDILDSYQRTDPDFKNADIKRLIFELDTNRIELELQNEDLRHAQEQLEKSHLKFNELYQGAPVGYLTLTGKGQIVEANRKAAEMLELERGRLIGQKMSSFICCEDQDMLHLHLQDLAETGRQHRCSLRLKNKRSNSLPHVQLESVLSQDMADASGQVFMTMTDVTDLVEARQEIIALNEELEQRVLRRTEKLKATRSQLLHSEKLAAIGTLAASIAHELNNPLQGVLNILKGVDRRAVLDAEDDELVGIAIGECERMRELLRALQDFNRPTSGIRAPINLHSTLDSVLLLYGKTLTTRNITLTRQYADDIPLVYAVADQIKQVIMNLLANSVDACAAGGCITVKTEGNHAYVAFSIMDDGVGIDPANKHRIYEPFFSTKSEVKGTGLGLSVSYGIIKNHNGIIEMNSSPGNGTVFRIKLPLRETIRS